MRELLALGVGLVLANPNPNPNPNPNQMRELLAAARQLYGAKKGELESLTQRFANGEIALPGEAQGEGADGAEGGEGDEP